MTEGAGHPSESPACSFLAAGKLNTPESRRASWNWESAAKTWDCIVYLRMRLNLAHVGSAPQLIMLIVI